MIRKMTPADADAVMAMMRAFYDSSAIAYDVPGDVLERDIQACLSDDPLIECYIIEYEGKIAGYAMVTRSYSTEFGGPCIWTEDLYLKPEYRGLRLAGKYFAALKRLYPDAVRYRLEVEPENTNARKAYRRSGYREVPYIQMDIH